MRPATVFNAEDWIEQQLKLYDPTRLVGVMT